MPDKKRFPAGIVAAVALGGAAGTLLRAWVAERWPPTARGFPWDTFTVNVIGAAILGFVVVLLLERSVRSPYIRPLIGTGFCGGLTTFSTWMVETDLLIKGGRVATAAAYLLGSLFAGLAAAWIGMMLARTKWSREVRVPLDPDL